MKFCVFQHHFIYITTIENILQFSEIHTVLFYKVRTLRFANQSKFHIIEHVLAILVQFS